MGMKPDDALALAEAAETRWMHLLWEGSHTLAEAAELLDPGAPDPARAIALRHSGELLAFEYAGGPWFPKHQFIGGSVLPAIPQLLTVARDAGATDTDLCLWMITRSSLFAEQDTPADHLADAAQVVEAAHIHFEAVW